MESVNCACELNLISQIEFWKMHKMQRILLIYLNHMHCQFEIIQILSTYSMIETKKNKTIADEFGPIQKWYVSTSLLVLVFRSVNNWQPKKKTSLSSHQFMSSAYPFVLNLTKY